MLGNIRPIDQKSELYQVMDLSKDSSHWTRLSLKEQDSTETSDIAYKAKRSASIISLNSACRTKADVEEKDLKKITQLLFMGISDLRIYSERSLLIQGSPGLESTVQGKVEGEEMMLRTIVLRRNNCVYDLIYMARPNFFKENEQDFAHFVDSLKLK